MHLLHKSHNGEVRGCDVVYPNYMCAGQMNKRQKVMDCVDSARLVRDTVLDNLNNGLFADMKQR